MRASRAPVAVTGLGAVTGYGCGVDAFWTGLNSGRSCIAEIRADQPFSPAAHRTSVAAVVDLPRHPLHSRADTFALEAARQALRQALGPGVPPPPRSGVFFGSSTGALLETEEAYADLHAGRRTRVRRLATQQHNGPGDSVARDSAITGPVLNLSSACASSSMAMVTALDALLSGEIDLAVVGGADELSQVTYAGFNALRAVSPVPSRPFCSDRKGLSLGEGAGVLVLESLPSALARGARILALLHGGAATCDAHHMSAPIGDGSGAARAMREALAESGLGTHDVHFVNVHGTGTPQNDAAEWRALQQVFGPLSAELPVVACKPHIGHLLGASGAIEAVATVACLRARSLPPVPYDLVPDPEIGIRLIHDTPHPLGGRPAGMSINLAFGGANSALVFRAPLRAEGQEAGP